MNRFHSSIIGSAIFACICVMPANAADNRGSSEEAKNMAIAATDFIKANGIEAAAKAFMTPGSSWCDRDLYIFITDDQGVSLVNGKIPSLVGKKTIDLRDVDGKLFVREMIAVKDSGWVDYRWRNPTTGTIDEKSSYVIRYNNLVIGVGIYKART